MKTEDLGQGADHSGSQRNGQLGHRCRSHGPCDRRGRLPGGHGRNSDRGYRGSRIRVVQGRAGCLEVGF